MAGIDPGAIPVPEDTLIELKGKADATVNFVQSAVQRANEENLGGTLDNLGQVTSFAQQLADELEIIVNREPIQVRNAIFQGQQQPTTPLGARVQQSRQPIQDDSDDVSFADILGGVQQQDALPMGFPRSFEGTAERVRYGYSENDTDSQNNPTLRFELATPFGLTLHVSVGGDRLAEFIRNSGLGRTSDLAGRQVVVEYDNTYDGGRFIPTQVAN